MAKKLYVGNLPFSCDNSELAQLFGQYGTVVSANIIMDRATGRSKGFGFVEMASDSEALEAADKLNGKDMNGRALTVNEAKPQENNGRPGGSGGSGGGRSGGGGGGRGAPSHSRGYNPRL